MEEPKNSYSARLRQLEELLAEEFGLYASLLRQGGTDLQDMQQHRNRLVEQLQYHDIIRQKIEHVREFQEIWEQGESCGAEMEESNLPSLFELSLALLRYTWLEYTEVREQTRRLLENSSTFPEILQQESSFELAIQELISKLEQDYLELENRDENVPVSLSPERIRQLRNTFSMKSERDVFALFFEEEVMPGDDEDAEPEGQVELF